MREGKKYDSQRGEHLNMRGRHVNNPDRRHRMPSSKPKVRQMPGSAPRPAIDDKVYRYYVLWKPYGVAAKFEDSKNARSLATYVPVEGVYPIGFLDATSEGILLLTDNPRFRFALNHSKCQEMRIFLAQVELPANEDIVSDDALDAMAEGVVLSDGKTMPLEVEVIEDPDLPERSLPVKEDKNTCWIAITCSEGWSRHIHRITAALGYPTLRLVQWSIGPVNLFEMTEGQLRELKYQEMRWVQGILDRTPMPITPNERQRFRGGKPQSRSPRHSQRFATTSPSKGDYNSRSERSERSERSSSNRPGSGRPQRSNSDRAPRSNQERSHRSDESNNGRL